MLERDAELLHLMGDLLADVEAIGELAAEDADLGDLPIDLDGRILSGVITIELSPSSRSNTDACFKRHATATHASSFSNRIMGSRGNPSGNRPRLIDTA